MKQVYVERDFKPASLDLIYQIDDICNNYARQRFILTVRQLYYQLVARNIIPNTERSYKNTTSLVNDARLAGLIDWNIIEDRTRTFKSRPHWEDGKEFITQVAPQFFADMWEDQAVRPFVIVEKEALAGVLEGVCRQYDVPMLAARGYPSVSVLREFALDRMMVASDAGQDIVILHLGDHDPSGIDMSRDLEDRLKLLTEHNVVFDLRRIALNMDQIKENRCPPNPAKITDSRAKEYIKNFGRESWELDALEPRYLVDLVTTHLNNLTDDGPWLARQSMIESTRAKLIGAANLFEKPSDQSWMDNLSDEERRWAMEFEVNTGHELLYTEELDDSEISFQEFIAKNMGWLEDHQLEVRRALERIEPPYED